MRKLDRLKYERREIKKIAKCIPESIVDAFIAYYDYDIKAIEKYGASNPIFEIKEDANGVY